MTAIPYDGGSKLSSSMTLNKSAVQLGLASSNIATPKNKESSNLDKAFEELDSIKTKINSIAAKSGRAGLKQSQLPISASNLALNPHVSPSDHKGILWIN